MSINFDLLDGAVQDAATNAGGIVHLQNNWLQAVPGSDAEQCGTAMCLAGFIAVRAGARPPEPALYEGEGWGFPEWSVNPETGAYLESDDPNSVPVADFAAYKAGLTGSQDGALFCGSNALDDIRAMVAHLHQHPDASGDDLQYSVDEPCECGWTP